MCILPSSGILPFLKNSRSMTRITWQAAVDDEEQQPLLQDILEAAVDDRRQAAVEYSYRIENTMENLKVCSWSSN